MTAIHDRISFHNVDHLEKKGELSGLLLQRFPDPIRLALGQGDHERGRFFAQVSTGCEIRFVTDAYFYRLSLSSYLEDTHVMIFCGDYLHSVHQIPAGKVTTLHIEIPPSLFQSESWVREGGRFDCRVWRVLFHKQSCGVFCELDAFGHEVRPPEPQEVPQIKWLAYGSSITFGGDVHLASNAYVLQAARRLGADVYNKAVAGSCFCDSAMIEYLSSLKGWDIATLELGINMLNRFTVEEFENRSRDLTQALLKANPGKPVVLITAYPAHALFGGNAAQKEKYLAFEEILKKIRQEDKSRCLHLIEGKDILRDVQGLTVDMTHPSDDGHIMMGQRLAEELERILKEI